MSRLNHLLIASVSASVLAIAGVGSAVAGNAFKVLHNFGGDGYPNYGLVLDPNTGQFFGVTTYGGDGCGVAYRLSQDGSHYSVIHTFEADGCDPFGGLLRNGATTFYGTAAYEAQNGDGAVYKLTNSGKLTVLHNFDGSNGNVPGGALAQDNKGNLYGATVFGGSVNLGVVYQLLKDGTFNVLATFDGSNGAEPQGGVILGNAHDGRNGSVLFGTTTYGGAFNNGVVFKVDVDKKQLKVLHSFRGGAGGASPVGGVIEGPQGNLYGTTGGDGNQTLGTVYKIATDGTYSNFHKFLGYSSKDGAQPDRNLLLTTSGWLYGTTATGGAVCDCGTVFGITADGTKYHILHSFNAATDGQNPLSDLYEDSKHTLYGTAFNGGPNGGGTVFSVKE